MPLSEKDQRALAQIEGALAQDDPAFSATIAEVRFRRLQRRWISIPALIFLGGTVLLIAGLVTTDALLGLGLGMASAAVLIMILAVALFYRHRHRKPTAPSETSRLS